MQALLTQMLWNSEEVHNAAARLCNTLPGYVDARRQYDEAAGQVQALIGYELFDRLCERLACCTAYETRAYYALGLGLRGELARGLCL